MATDSRPPPDPLFVLRGHEAAVTALALAPHRVAPLRLLISGTETGDVWCWDLRTRRTVRAIRRAHSAGILSLHFSPRGELVSQGRDGLVKLWSMASFTTLRDEEEDESETAVGGEECTGVVATQSLSFGKCATHLLPSGALLLASPTEHQSHVGLWLVDRGHLVGVLAPERSVGMCMSCRFWCPDDGRSLWLLVGCEDGCVYGWDLSSRPLECADGGPAPWTCASPQAELRLQTPCPIMAMSLVPGGGQRLVCCGAGCKITAAQLRQETSEGLLLASEPQHAVLKHSGFSAISVRFDGKLVVVGGWDATVRLFQTRGMKPLAVLRFHRKTVQDVCFAPDDSGTASPEEPEQRGNVFATCSGEQIVVWSMY